MLLRPCRPTKLNCTTCNHFNINLHKKEGLRDLLSQAAAA